MASICFKTLRWLIVINIVLNIEVQSLRLLGESCHSNEHCSVSHSQCNRGVCDCQPYYARVDVSTCLESTLLGSECFVSEQCTLKVAYSACLEGVCRCTDGHLQFRKHTCLSPAPPGHVCYSNEHCRLWDKESHCEFVIPNLFGRCACSSLFKQVGDKCIPQKIIPSIAQSETHEGTMIVQSTSEPQKQSQINSNINSDFNPPNTNIDTDDIEAIIQPTYTSNDALSTEEDSPLSQVSMKLPTAEPAKILPITNRRDGEPNETLRDDMTANLHANDQPVYRVVTQPTVNIKKKDGTTKVTQTKPHKHGHPKKSTLKDKYRIRTESTKIDLGPSSLGMPCLIDTQCQQVDPHTRCVNKRCDCAYRSNSTSACSTRNRGCLPGTFQCRSTGTCISWYFVCNGRKDCPDGSDETCQDGTGERCPMHAFRCGGPGSPCVSRGARCDGVPQCPGGEDERNCKATRRKGCPRHTFRCGSGECLPEYEFCNAIVSCKDASDEPPHLCNEQSRWRAADFCPLRCGNGRCRSTAVACSGRDGCGDNSDEIACNVCSCPAPPSVPL
ncbi:serine protease nudel-like isoform X2 [Hyposmocoma kahamanoa]|uniref:serine protease nudel-like isoform X2 n=1 Tax=Hyposmocoma kahamanoa TaxID=1477025 RepID=UPI000E6D9F3D|nr:serine protease nudel-like isoform X2 [Hyposmocoma kahamanoa]